MGFCIAVSAGISLSRMVTERKASYKEVKHLYFIAVRIANGLMKKNSENEQITFLQIQKVILHLLKKEVSF